MGKLIVRNNGVDRKAQFPDDMPIADIRTFLRNKYFQDEAQGVSRALDPAPQTAAPVEQSLVDKAGQTVADFLFDKGIITDRYRAQETGRTLSGLAEFLPGLGDATAGDEFGRAVAQGDKLGMGLGMLGAIPVAGDLAKKGIKKLPDYEELELFHGTNKDFDRFDVDAVGEFSSADTSGNISMTPFFDEAESYSRGGQGGSPRVIKSDFKGRVKFVDDLEEHDAYEMMDIEEKAREQGFDAVYYSGIQDSSFYNPMGSTDTVKVLNPKSITQTNKNFTKDDYRKDKFISLSGKGKYSDDELKDLLKINDADINRYRKNSTTD